GLCTPGGLGALKTATLLKALGDSHQGVRKNAVRLCEPHMEPKSELDDAITSLLADEDWQVRLHVAYVLGATRDNAAVAFVLPFSLLQYAGDPLMSAALTSSVTRDNIEPIATYLSNTMSAEKGSPPPAATVVENVLRTATGFAKHDAVAGILKELVAVDPEKQTAWQFAILDGWLNALDQGNSPLPRLADQHPRLKPALQSLNQVFEEARAKVTDLKSPSWEKLLAIRLLGRGLTGQEKDLATLSELLTPRTPSDLQAAAVNS